MKNIDSDFVIHFQKIFQNDFRTAKGKSEAFYNDLLGVFFL
jgi:hypothetical protein